MTYRLSFPFPVPAGLQLPVEYPELRRQSPLTPITLPSGDPALLVTRHEDVKTVLSDPAFSRAAFGGGSMFARQRKSLALAASDPPEHTRRRHAVAHAFTARRARQQRPELERLARDLLASMRGAGSPVDVVESFTLPFAISVVCRLLGVPVEDRHRFHPWVEAMMSTRRFPPDHVADAHGRMHDYFATVLSSKRVACAAGEPPDGLLAELVRASRPECRLSRDELVVLGAGLLIAGYETTSNQLAICVYLLSRDTSLQRRLRAWPSLIPMAIEEMLRWTSFMTTGGPPHIAVEDVPLTGAVVRAGEIVVPLFDAANRDGAVFTEPHRLVPDRDRNPHLAFGYGKHFCLGASLARTELQVAIAGLLDEFAHLELAMPEQELSWRSDMFLRGLWALPVRWKDRDAA